MDRDPYSNTQTKFERTDRSGRYSQIHEPTQEAWWVPLFGGMVAGALMVLGIYLVM